MWNDGRPRPVVERSSTAATKLFAKCTQRAVEDGPETPVTPVNI
jgi:hypothetical protein